MKFNINSFACFVVFRNRAGPKFTPHAHKLKGGLFGFNYGVRKTGFIKIGDPVYRLKELQTRSKFISKTKED